MAVWLQVVLVFGIGPVSRIPDDEDDDPVVLLTHPDGSPRAARVRRSR